MALTKSRGTSQIKSGSITNAEISASAGIELGKLNFQLCKWLCTFQLDPPDLEFCLDSDVCSFSF